MSDKRRKVVGNFSKMSVMDKRGEVTVVSAERLNGGVIVSFGDGRCAIFSAKLLYEHIDEAQQVSTAEEDE